MRRFARWIAVVAVLGIVAAACGGDDEPAPGTETPTDIQRGGTLHLADTSEPNSAGFDPAKEYFQTSFGISKCCLLRTLYATNGLPVDQGGSELRADLASDLPTTSGDGLTWTFPIKQGVLYAPPFEDVEITADDFIRALTREADADASAGGYSFYYSAIEGFDDVTAGDAKEISGLSAPDPYTLEVTVTEPTGDLGWRMAMPATAPIPPDDPSEPLGAAEGHTRDYGRFLVASGPYMFEGSENMDFSLDPKKQEPAAGYIPGRSVVMVRNPSWDAATDELRPAYVDQIEIEIGGAIDDLYNKLNTGELDYVITPPEAKTLKQYSTDPDLQDRLFVYPTNSVSYISMNLALPPFDDIHVRKALNFAIDKAGGRQLAGGPLVGTNAGHIFPDGLLDNLLKTYDPYASTESHGDIEKAKAEMAQSQYDTDQDGVCDDPSCEKIAALTASDSPTAGKAAALYAQNVEPLGITFDVKALATTTMYAKCNQLDAQIPICLAVGWIQDYPDAYTFGPPLFGGSDFGALSPGCCNYSALGATPQELEDYGYSITTVPSVDDKLTACKALPVGDERTQCWADLDRFLMEEVVPWVPRTYTNTTDVIGPNVTNYSFDEFSGFAAFDHMAVADTSA